MIIKFELTKKHLYITLALLAMLGAALAAADVNLAGAWHDAEDIEIQASGSAMTLQQALDSRMLEVGSALFADKAITADKADNTQTLCGKSLEQYCVPPPATQTYTCGRCYGDYECRKWTQDTPCAQLSDSCTGGGDCFVGGFT